MVVGVSRGVEILKLLLELVLILQLEPYRQVNRLGRVGGAQILRFADPAGCVAADLDGVPTARIRIDKMSAGPRYDGEYRHKPDNDC